MPPAWEAAASGSMENTIAIRSRAFLRISRMIALWGKGSQRMIDNPSSCSYLRGMERDRKGLAMVVRSASIKDNDRLLTLFSPSLGLLDVVSYGARKSIRTVKAPLYTEGNFSIEKGRRGWTLKDIDVISTHDYILSDLARSQAAMLFSDLVMTGRDASPELYSLLADAIDLLETDSAEKVAVEFIVHYLALAGISGDYRTCPVCGRAYGRDEILGFSSAEGIAVCHDCDTMGGALLLPPNARAYLGRSLEMGIRESMSLSVSEAQEHRIFRYLLRTLPLSFPGKLRSLEYGIWDL